MRTLLYLAALTVAVPTAVEVLVPTVSLTRAAFAEEGHKHGKDEKRKLGRQSIAGYTVSVIIVGDPHEEKSIDFDVKLIDAKTEPKAIRVWIGTEDGAGSTKAALTKKTTTYVGVAAVPSPLPAGSKVWVEIETDAGTNSGSYSIEDGHKH